MFSGGGANNNNNSSSGSQGSSGYCSDTLLCPYVRSGLCYRPYCQFKHVKVQAPQSAVCYGGLADSTDECHADTGEGGREEGGKPAQASSTADQSTLDNTVDRNLVEQVTLAVLAALKKTSTTPASSSAPACSSGDATTRHVAAIVSQQLEDSSVSATCVQDSTDTAVPLPEKVSSLQDPASECQAVASSMADTSHTRGHKRSPRVFQLPTNISYSPTPIRELELRSCQARFSDDDDDNNNSNSGEAYSGERPSEEEGQSPPPALVTTTTTTSVSSSAEKPVAAAAASTTASDFDLLEQIMAESRRPLTSTLACTRDAKYRRRETIIARRNRLGSASVSSAGAAYIPSGGATIGVYRPTPVKQTECERHDDKLGDKSVKSDLGRSGDGSVEYSAAGTCEEVVKAPLDDVPCPTDDGGGGDGGAKVPADSASCGGDDGNGAASTGSGGDSAGVIGDVSSSGGVSKSSGGFLACSVPPSRYNHSTTSRPLRQPPAFSSDVSLIVSALTPKKLEPNVTPASSAAVSASVPSSAVFSSADVCRAVTDVLCKDSTTTPSVAISGTDVLSRDVPVSSSVGDGTLCPATSASSAHSAGSTNSVSEALDSGTATKTGTGEVNTRGSNPVHDKILSIIPAAASAAFTPISTNADVSVSSICGSFDTPSARIHQESDVSAVETKTDSASHKHKHKHRSRHRSSSKDRSRSSKDRHRSSKSSNRRRSTDSSKLPQEGTCVAEGKKQLVQDVPERQPPEELPDQDVVRHSSSKNSTTSCRHSSSSHRHKSTSSRHKSTSSHSSSSGRRSSSSRHHKSSSGRGSSSSTHHSSSSRRHSSGSSSLKRKKSADGSDGSRPTEDKKRLKSEHSSSVRDALSAKDDHHDTTSAVWSDDDCRGDDANNSNNYSEDSMDEADRVLAECERMFNEYQPPPQSTNLHALNKAKEMRDRAAMEASQLSASSSDDKAGKQRTAHSGSELVARNCGARVARRISAVQAMQARWQKLAELQQARIVELEQQAAQQQQQQLSTAVSTNNNTSTTCSTSGSGPSTGSVRSQTRSLPFSTPTSSNKRIRVAHVPNVSALLVRPPVPSNSLSNPATSAKVHATVSRSVAKGTSRVAHQPSAVSVSRPRIINDSSSKVPIVMRQRHLDLLCSELEKHFPENQAEAFKQALAEEQSAHDRVSSRAGYPHAIASTLRRLRASSTTTTNSTSISTNNSSSVVSRATGNVSVGADVVGNRTISHRSVLAGKGATLGSWSIEKNKHSISIDSVGEFHALLSRHVLSEQQLEQNGYPRAASPGRALVRCLSSRLRVTRAGATRRECVRCSRGYAVDGDGNQVCQEQCVYHWGRIYTFRGEKRYSCCSTEPPAEGCCVADVHVSDNFDPDNLTGYQETFSKSDSSEDDQAVYALDCEMCYTTGGCELTRITVVDMTCSTVYETLVKPANAIIDYNTRFSGITAEDMKNVTVSISDVQAVLLSMFSDKTILIGHSLESDFKALKLIHSKVVDTSVVFPHKLGPPFKRALRNLVSDHLKKIIQNDVGGHDSAEDAQACVELMLWKLKEDAKCFR